MPTKKKAAPPAKRPAPPKPYSLLLKFSPEDVKMLEALEKDTRLRRTPLIRHLLADEAKRRGLS